MRGDARHLDPRGLDPRDLEDGEYSGLRLTADQFLELVDGVVVMTAGPALRGVSPRHSEVALRSAQQLLEYCDRTGAAQIFAGVSIRFSDDMTPDP